jgi:hypothetical protein
MREGASAHRQRMEAGRLATRTGLVGLEAGHFCAVGDERREGTRPTVVAVTLRLARIPTYLPTYTTNTTSAYLHHILCHGTT